MPPLIQKSNENPYTKESHIYGWYEKDHTLAVFNAVAAQFPDMTFILRGEELDYSIWVGLVDTDLNPVKQAVATAHQTGDQHGEYAGHGPYYMPWALPLSMPPITVPIQKRT